MSSQQNTGSGYRSSYKRRGGQRRGRGYKGRGRGKKRPYRGNRASYSGVHNKRYSPYRKHHNNDTYQLERIQNELNLTHTQRDIHRFMEKWDQYTEQQTFSKIICDIPLMKLRNEALKVINNNNHNNNTSTTTDGIKPANDDNTTVFIDGYEVGQKLQLKYTEETSITDTITVKTIGNMNWKLLEMENDDAYKMECIEKHLTVPAHNVPRYNPPSIPFKIWKHKQTPCVAYKYPICVPASAIVLTAKKCDIDFTKYDFISLRRTVKRILSFSEQLNTSFQCINGVIFTSDVPITDKYFPYNYGFQFEMHCVGATQQTNGDRDRENENEIKEDINTENKECAMDEDADDVIGNDIMRRMKEEEHNKCVPLRRDSDYYHLIEMTICDLKILLCAEIDCVDDEGNGIELKFGIKDRLVSTWSQCLFSGISNIIQAEKTFQTLCVAITGLRETDISCYYSSKPHQNAQLLVFYNILKDIKQKLMTSAKSKDNNDTYRVSDMYRLTRHRSHTQATLFKVDDARNLISKEQWEYLVKKD